MKDLNGALLINKHSGVTSFGIIELLQRQFKKQAQKSLETGSPENRIKIGHGGTLDPFATGLLILLVGRGVKLARYFLGSRKTYEGVIRFGETTVSGDLTSPISEVSSQIPSSIEKMQELALSLTTQPYLQIPPMHSAKKKNGRPLYELARKGIEIEREPRLCHLYEFKILDYQAPTAKFYVECSSGTYIRKLSQDFAQLQGSIAALESLCRVRSGVFSLENAMTVEEIEEAGNSRALTWDQLPCWIPFDRLLDDYTAVQATEPERTALCHGKQEILVPLLKRNQIEENSILPGKNPDCVAIYQDEALVAVARLDNQKWGIERVF